jgi:hypothetical protein
MDFGITSKTSRTPEKIFADMHRELRAWNPEIPESPERLDPILKVLLQLYAHQLSVIDKRIDMVWEMAANSLIRSVCPESKRWPVPAYTVMRCKPSDPVVEVDHNTRFFYREKREGGQTFFFSAIRKERLISAEVKYIFLKSGGTIINLSPMAGIAASPQSRLQASFTPGGSVQIFIAVAYKGLSSGFRNATLFLKGIPDALRQLRWASWYSGVRSGEFSESAGFCPGMSADFSRFFSVDDRPIDWGGLRTGQELFKTLEDNLVMLPEEFASSWEPSPINGELSDVLSAQGISLTGKDMHYWIRLDLPPGGDKSKLQSPFEVHFNCFLAVNKNELTLFKHTGGNRLVEVELPEDITNILEIIHVFDSGGREYLPYFMVRSERSQKSYSLEERDDRLVLWFDFSSDIELPPDSITISYSVTAGTGANGIEAGKICELYESHPGIVSAENIIPAGGAIPAKTEKQIVTEVSSRLRNRDRALSFSELSDWAMTFDPRIKGVECKNGVERADRGVRRCVIVRVQIKGTDFYSNDEASLLQKRLTAFLKSRSAVNTHFVVEIIKE